MDKVSKEVRSGIMRKIHSANNKSTERRFKAGMIKAGLRGWKTHPDTIFNPDFIFEDNKLAIFIDGCFWHRCPICNKMPASNLQYWDDKFEKNIDRDIKAKDKLTEEGWVVIRFWEHEVRNSLSECISKLKMELECCKSRYTSESKTNFLSVIY